MQVPGFLRKDPTRVPGLPGDSRHPAFWRVRGSHRWITRREWVSGRAFARTVSCLIPDEWVAVLLPRRWAHSFPALDDRRERRGVHTTSVGVSAGIADGRNAVKRVGGDLVVELGVPPEGRPGVGIGAWSRRSLAFESSNRPIPAARLTTVWKSGVWPPEPSAYQRSWPRFCERVQSQGKGEAMNAAAVIDRGTFRSNIPSRLDRLPWSGWHWRVVLALGITWVIDGLEVTLVGAVSPVLQRPDTLGFSSSQNGLPVRMRSRPRCWL